jgi:hypothetical protein
LQSISKGKKFTPIEISEDGLELIELIALDCENDKIIIISTMHVEKTQDTNKIKLCETLANFAVKWG